MNKESCGRKVAFQHLGARIIPVRTLFRYLVVTTLVLGLAWTAVGVRVKGRTLYGHAADLGRPAIAKAASWWKSFDPKTGVVGIGEGQKAKSNVSHAPSKPASPVAPAETSEVQKNDENVAHLKKMASLAAAPVPTEAPDPKSGSLDELIRKKLDAHP
ncbi:MAG: hypothetical protein HYV07_04975 [Deltaproteobacteria bacterium]|nr:hypothetical protein [Deltaproteobacteria bacterium]